jgi:hypothetical protein
LIWQEAIQSRYLQLKLNQTYDYKIEILFYILQYHTRNPNFNKIYNKMINVARRH